MSINASRVLSLRKTVVSNQNFIMTAFVGVCMILLAYFILDEMIAGTFGVWDTSFIGVAVGGYLLLQLWGAYN